MKDKKAAKLILKRAKKHPELYSKEEVKFAKIFRKQLKLEKKHNEREVDNGDPQSGTAHGLRGTSEQSQEPRQPKRGWFAEILHKASTLVGL